MDRHRVHGHPRGRSIPNCAYERELMQARRYLAQATDERTQAVLRHIAQWRHDPLRPAQGEMARLTRHGVDAPRLLAEWIALYMYSRRNPSALPEDVRLNFALANKTLRLAPREVARTMRPPSMAYAKRIYRMPTRAEREALGTYIRFHYVMYLAEVAAVLDQHSTRTAIPS
jgi:hypothetical protein